MFGLLMGRAKTIARIVFALSVLISARAQAQSLVGTWTTQGSDWVWFLNSSGRAVGIGTGIKSSCAGVSTQTSTFSTSANVISFVGDPQYACGSNTFSQTPGTITANYVLSGNALTFSNLSTTDLGSSSFTLTQAPAQTISIVGNWNTQGLDWVWSFQNNGQFTVTGTGVGLNCETYSSLHGNFTASGGVFTITSDSTTCNGVTTTGVGPAWQGGYVSTGNTLTFFVLQTSGPNVGQTYGFILNPQGGQVAPAPTTTITPTTPLPPPPTVQTVFTASSGLIPPAVVQVNASGTYGNASLSVILDTVDALQAVPSAGFAASTYNAYVIALVPGAVLGSASPVIFIKSAAGWGALQFPIAPYLANVAQGAVNNQVLIEILTNNDITSLVGTEIYIGYGLSDAEMLSSGRYRGVYKVQ